MEWDLILYHQRGYLSRDLKDEGANYESITEKNVPDGENSRWKDPEWGIALFWILL